MSDAQKFHFIAIGGSVMHNLAISLKTHGHQVTGSDDDIKDPARANLIKHHLLPTDMGWHPDRIDNTVDAVILGMHARKDNPELLKAQSIGIPIYSFPEFIFNQSIDKQRIVITGSHGKTTITAIILHVLTFFKRKFDYVIGAAQDGLELSVQLSDAPIIIIEGDEYPASPIDPTAKFLRFQHHVAIISGIAWDHANVFPNRELYNKQFELLADATPKGGTLIYNNEDKTVEAIGKKERVDVQTIPYQTHPYKIENGVVYLVQTEGEHAPIQLFGNHNLQNISAAKELLKKIGITSSQFYEALPTFKGARGRLEKILEHNETIVFKDFAHAPSKVKATTLAVKSLYPKRQLVGCLELHTFSSLNKNYLSEYTDSMKACDTAVVYFNPEVINEKGLEPLDETIIKKAFNKQDLIVLNDTQALETYLSSLSWRGKNLLMMSSGHFNGLSIPALAQKLKTE